MTDDKQHDPWPDPALMGKPVTRFELWEACQMLRTLSLNIYIQNLAHQVGDRAESAQASQDIRKTQARLEKMLDQLVGTKRLKNDG